MTHQEIIQALQDGREIVKMTYYFSRGKKNKAGGTVKYKIGKETIKSTQVDKLREDGLLIKSSESINSVTYKLSEK